MGHATPYFKASAKFCCRHGQRNFSQTKRYKKAIKKAGHSLIFLPPYSPDLNPIEQKWA
ncbi:MAG: transposase [Pseudomonadota bacterium]